MKVSKDGELDTDSETLFQTFGEASMHDRQSSNIREIVFETLTTEDSYK